MVQLRLDKMIQDIQEEVMDVRGSGWLTPQQVADELCLHVNSVYRLIRSGELLAHDLGRGRRRWYRIRRADMEDWLVMRQSRHRCP